MRVRLYAVVVVSLAMLGAPARAQDTGDSAATVGTNGDILLLPREREIALAESAGPADVAKSATIYVLNQGGYQVARQGTNGFSCIVERSEPETLEPTCFDPEGTEVLLPKVLESATLRGAGKSAAEVEKSIAEGYSSGKFRAPRRGGVAYMLSKENKVSNGQRVISYPPHVMIYAPYVTNKDIGADFSNPFHPWVLSEGTPNAYIMVVVGEPSPPKDAAASQPSPEHDH